MAEYLTRRAAHLPGTRGFQAAQSWYQIERARLHGRPLTLLPHPPPRIAGMVPWLHPILSGKNTQTRLFTGSYPPIISSPSA